MVIIHKRGAHLWAPTQADGYDQVQWDQFFLTLRRRLRTLVVAGRGVMGLRSASFALDLWGTGTRGR